MEFFNKKQDVLDIELTSYGKQLLSRGLFKPVYYAFSDDGILYDQKWISGSATTEQQSSVEQRIQNETPRIKTQNRKVGAERAIYNHVEGNSLGLVNINSFDTLNDLFEFSSYEELIEKKGAMELKVNFAESEKLLENTLGTKSYFNDYNPAWNLLLYHGYIASTTTYYKKNDIVSDVPQINITLVDNLYKLDLEDIPEKTIPAVKNILSLHHISEPTNIDDLYFDNIAVDDGKAFIIKDFLFLSLEEKNVNFTKDNFMIEIFEVTTTVNSDNGEEELVKMNFDDYGDSALNIFEISVDDEIDASIACALINHDKTLKDQNIYTSNVFDCSKLSIGTGVNIDPYTNLPDVDVGDTC